MTDSMLLATTVSNALGDGVPAGRIAAVLDFAYRGRRKKPASMDLLITDDAEIARLNRRHLRHDGATDVLSFEDGDVEEGRLRLGDVVISAETAKRVAAERCGDYEQELIFYALHGMYHLLGMRDDSPDERAAMLQAQARAMRDFGLPVSDDLAASDA